MARRLRYYKKVRVGARPVQRLMRFTRRYLQSLPRLKRIKSSIDLHGEFASQHIEELPRADVGVTLLLRTRRHAFLDHAEIVSAQQVPTIADDAPHVMFGVGGTHRLVHSGMLPCFLGGFLSRLPSSISSAAIKRRRVSCGRITAST